MTKMTPQQLIACEQAEIPKRVLRWFVEHSVESDTFDIVSEYQNNLTESENIELIKEKLIALQIYLPSKTEFKNYLDAQQDKAIKQVAQAYNDYNDRYNSIEWDYILKQDIKCIALLGNGGSGKTALVYHILNHNKKPVYVLKHPNKSVLAQHGFNMMYSLEEFEHLKDCMVWIDEPQLHIQIYDHHANEVLQRMLSIARQNNITLILSTCETRFVTKGLEPYIDVWVVKDIEPSLVKQGSMVKKIIKDNVFIDINGFKLEKNQYIFYSRNLKQYNGKHGFVKPSFFDDRHSKPYRVM
jgi:hypothetical protein